MPIPSVPCPLSQPFQRLASAAAAAALALLLGSTSVTPLGAQAGKLQFKEYTGDSTAFDVNSTVIYGPTEAILVDCQYKVSDAKKVADLVAETGKHLKAIFITHPDDDHYYGLATILQRFPGTPVYMAPVALSEFKTRELANFNQMKERIRNAPPGAGPPASVLAELPDSLVVPSTPPGSELKVDGVKIQIVADQQGDVLKPANSYLWIPSQKTVLTGDLVFNGVHPWLAASSEASRAEWRKAIQKIQDLKPKVVIAGHKSSVDAPDTPDALAATSAYLTDFDAAKAAAAGPPELVSAMDQKHPGLAVHMILMYAARKAFGM